MRRTYRSKKDVGGGLDHRDVLLNLDEKRSVFDAFYIQNIKQTKKELSSIGSSTHYGVASNRVRKRKYVKRIVKEVEPPRKESLSHSIFLTPDKSIRVNRGLDPFDMLLNSSPAAEAQYKTDETDSCEKKPPSRRPAVTYARKKQLKKRNYINSDSTDSEKENSSDLSNTLHNVTDIKAHKLLVEKEHTESALYGDVSINKIVKNLSILNNFKKTFKESPKTPKFYRHRLTQNLQSPILQQSPLCSTPFKEKYRGQSIYKFSPIVATHQESSNFNSSEVSGCNDSVLFVCKNKSDKDMPTSIIPEASDNCEKANISNKVIDSNKLTEIYEHKLQEEHLTQELTVGNEDVDDKIAIVLNDSNIVPVNEISSFHTTEMEPFLGFTSNETEDLIDKKNRIEELCNNNTNTNLNKTEKINVFHLSNSQFTDAPHSIEKECVQDDSFGHTSTSDIESNDKESIYDTCDSEYLSDENMKEPVVNIERMSDSLFLKYYEKMSDQQHTKTTENTEIIYESNRDDTYEYNANSTSNRSDFSTGLTDEISSCDTSDVSTSEDATTCHNTASSSSNDEQCISFVTTRRRNEVAGKSMETFFDNFNVSSELETTVLSNKNTQRKSNLNRNQVEDLNSSAVKRRRRRYSKSSINVDNAICTDSDDDPKEVTFYAFPPTSEDVGGNSVKKQRKSPKRRSTRKSRKSEISSPKSTIELGNSNMVIEKFTTDESISDIISDNPPVCTDSDDVIITNVAADDNLKENIENTINILSSVSENSDSDSEVTFYTPNEADNIKIPESKTISMTRTSSKQSRTSTQADYVAENKPFMSSDTVSTVTTRKPSKTINEYDINTSLECIKTVGDTKPGIVLQPGKKWERSLSIYRRMTMMTDSLDHSILDESMHMKGRRYRQSVISTMEMQDGVNNDSIISRRSTFVSKPRRSTIRIVKDFNNTRTSLYTSAVFDDLKGFLADDCDDTIVELSKLSIADADPEVTVLELHETSNRLVKARDYVLRRCNQTDAILFDECYPDTVLKNCRKIGEGVYGEVFLWRDRDGRARVMKIVPIAGSTKVNGEDQKDYSEIISEIVIAMELSALRAPIPDIERHFEEGNDASALDLHAVENATDVFNEVLAVRCVYGNYPSRLLDLWDLYDECTGSENDNPAILPLDQQYIVLELANAGQDLESYQFNNAEQAYALFYQIAFGLAVGEEAYQFEHRDLHWGNVLIAPTEQKLATFILRGRAYRIPRRGVSATIIDYSLSRLSLPTSPAAAACERAALYNELSNDEGLFDAVGDYQFHVYRLMRDKLGNDWKKFEPYTNILWLHYTVDKMITALRYKRTNTKIHKHYIEKLKGIKDRILDYKSSVEFVLTDYEY